jgi:hypothetical protein
LKNRVTHVGLRPHLLKRIARLPLAKTEGTEGTEGVREDAGGDGVDGVSVRRAIGVAKGEAGGDSALDD